MKKNIRKVFADHWSFMLGEVALRARGPAAHRGLADALVPTVDGRGGVRGDGHAATLPQARLFGVVFAPSSLVTPYFLGAVVGAIASGRVPLAGPGDVWASWLDPTSILAGLMTVGTSSFLAGVFLTADAARSDAQDLAASLRWPPSPWAWPRARSCSPGSSRSRRTHRRCGQA